MRVILSCAVLAFASTPCLAQDNSTEQKAKPFAAELDVAPLWTTESPFDYEGLTESTSVSLKISAETKIAPEITTKFTLASIMGVDDDGDDVESGSSLAAEAKLSYALRDGLSLVTTFGRKASFTDVFGANAGDDTNYGGGVEFKQSLPNGCPLNRENDKCKISFSMLYTVTDAYDAAKDQRALQAKIGLELPFIELFLFDVAATGTQRWFDQIDSVTRVRQHRTDWAINGGFDFSPYFKRLDLGGLEALIDKVKIGYQYLQRDSNLDGKDKRAASPSGSLRLKYAF